MFFYKKILLIKITVVVHHPMGVYICINPRDSPLAKYTAWGRVFGLGTDPLGLIHIVLRDACKITLFQLHVKQLQL